MANWKVEMRQDRTLNLGSTSAVRALVPRMFTVANAIP